MDRLLMTDSIVCVGEERPDHDTTTTQCDDTTVQVDTDENTDVTTANTEVMKVNNENAHVEEQDTWVQVVDRRKRKKNNSNQIVSRSTLSRNNPVT
jgi:hypothetical protein